MRRLAFGLMSPSHAASTGLRLPRAASATACAAASGSVTATGEYIASSASTPGSASAAAGRRGEALGRRVADDVERIAARPLRRQFLIETGNRFLLNCASCTPFSAALSAATTPGPPPLVTMARRSPSGRRPVASTRAAAKSWV